MAAVSGLAARIKITAQTATTDASEATTLVGGTTSAYQIDDTSKRLLDRSVVPTILDGVTPIASSDLSINYLTGTVTMSTSASGAVTFTDFSYLTSSFLVGGKSWSVSASADAQDVTTFSTDATDPTWKTFQQGMKDATVTIDRLTPQPSTATPTFFDLLNLGADFVVQLYPDNAAGDRWEGFAYVTEASRTASVSDVQTEGVTLVLDGPLAFTTA